MLMVQIFSNAVDQRKILNFYNSILHLQNGKQIGLHTNNHINPKKNSGNNEFVPSTNITVRNR